MFCYLEILYWFFFVSFLILFFSLTYEFFIGIHDTISSAINQGSLNSRILLMSLTILFTTQFCIYLAETISTFQYSYIHVSLNIFSIVFMFLVILIPGGRSFRDETTYKNKEICDYSHSIFAILSLLCSWISTILYLKTFFNNINVLFIIFCFLLIFCLPCCCSIFLCCQCRSEEFKKLLYRNKFNIISLKDKNDNEITALSLDIINDKETSNYYKNTNRITLFF